MPIPASVLYPPFQVVRLNHVVLQVSDLARARAFWSDTLGLQVTDEAEGCVYLRAMEERGHHCILLRDAATHGAAGEPTSDAVGRPTADAVGKPTAEVLGFKVFSEEDLDRAQDWLRGQGLPVRWVERPYQGRTLLTQDPLGVPLEFFFRQDRLPSIHQKYALYRGVKPLRIDHFNCFSPDVEASVRFYTGMGFRTTEYTEEEGTGRLWAAWMHRKGGVHDMAFTHGVGPRLHHVAFWVSTPLNIIDLLDLMATTGHVSAIERGPGRHGISNAFFLYIRDPDGHRIEIYCSDYQTVDPDHEPIRWDLRDPQRQTLWGAPAPRSWFEEGTPFADTPTREPTYKASPIVAA